MFSGLVSHVSSSLSPKAWLAKHTAQALNDFFLLDDEDNTSHNIKSNLLTDTKIILRDVRVRPRQLHERAWLSGVVHEMDFSWSWGGGGGGSSFVKDTRVIIRGANFQIRIGPEEEGGSVLLSTAAPNPSTESTKTDSDGYIQQQIQQIVDHLALEILDFSLKIGDKPTQSPHCGVHIQAKSLQLVSFGRQVEPEQASDDSSLSSSPPLLQRISLESVQIGLQSSTDPSKSLPLLESIGCTASVKRVSGQRFLDKWTTGLEIMGEVLRSNGFVIHAKAAQVSTLS